MHLIGVSSVGTLSRCHWAIIILVMMAGFVSPTRGADAAKSTWTKGHRKILVIPVSFTDAAGPTNSDARGFSGWNNFTNGTTQAEINNFFLKQSYGQFSVEFTILPVIPLGVATNYYTNICPGTPKQKWTVWGAPGSLADDARAKARAMGLTNGQAAKFESANYDMDIIATGYLLGQAGAAADGGRAVIAFNYFTALSHEIGHCLGLQHANGRSSPTFISPLAAIFSAGYGNVFDLMGWKEDTHTANPPPDRDANPSSKFELGWLTTNNLAMPVASGLYRVHAFDQGVVSPGLNYALRIQRDAGNTYWLYYRQAITNLPDAKWTLNGLEVIFGADNPKATSGTTVLWDMTPGSRGPTNATYANMHDAPLAIGRTYTDAGVNLHVTPVTKGGTSPESLDVMVNFGPFPGNHAPTLTLTPTNITLGAGVGQTFTATGADADGDPLAYYWEFDDNQALGGTDFGGVNPDSRYATNGFHAWTQNGINFVRCTVSDMKGKTKTVSVTVMVTNGLPAPVTFSGTVKDEAGSPLEGAIVNNLTQAIYGATNFAGSSLTGPDGKYIIAIPVTNKNYYLTVMYQGYTFTNANGHSISTNYATASGLINVNFTRKRQNRTIGGQVYLAGHGYQSATNGDLWVSNGSTNILITNTGWQLTVPDGTAVTLTATATNPNYTITSYFSNPYLVVDNYNAFAFFVDVPGAMPLTGFTSSGTNSDDSVGTVNIPVTMTLPPSFTNWGGDQVFYCGVDARSTAQYGVDYKMSGASITFFGAQSPVPYNLPLTIISNGVPKNKTVIIKLWPGSSVANLGPISTFTYTISNPPPAVSPGSVTNGVFNFTWPAVSAGHYTIETTATLNPPTWSEFRPHTNLTGIDGIIQRNIAVDTVTNRFFRVRID
ncbi:MAG: hypothetical protein EXS33_06910 [Pedosphaera sp.]|nr:hypothetical protein [Pedosphaera sp.]